MAGGVEVSSVFEVRSGAEDELSRGREATPDYLHEHPWSVKASIGTRKGVQHDY